jgi:hypothetical protein
MAADITSLATITADTVNTNRVMTTAADVKRS